MLPASYRLGGPVLRDVDYKGVAAYILHLFSVLSYRGFVPTRLVVGKGLRNWK
jgi:hypothetical protein